MVMVDGLIEIARRLGICVVAEGIETEVQASQLWTMGCKLGQGFAFAQAADRDATAALLRRHAAEIEGVTRLRAKTGCASIRRLTNMHDRDAQRCAFLLCSLMGITH